MIPRSKILFLKELRDKAFIFGMNLVFILPAKIRPIALGADSRWNEIRNLSLLDTRKRRCVRFKPERILRANFHEKREAF